MNQSRTAYFVAVLIVSAISHASAQSFTMDEYRQLHQQLQSSDQASWRTIPWMTSLLEAQNKAAAARKPIFIWAMDGHPLGCT